MLPFFFCCFPLPESVWPHLGGKNETKVRAMRKKVNDIRELKSQGENLNEGDV